MYIQITTRCNMECGHCCYACTADGEDMVVETYKKALGYDDIISIGGGEPTIHPKFWEFLGLALGMCSEYVWLATNGKETDIAMALAGLAKRGAIGCDLSQDYYHDEIEQCVVNAFSIGTSALRMNDQDQRKIRTVNDHEVNGGRCNFGTDDRCVCSDLVCKPNGDVYACGCENAPYFGNVNTEVVIPDDWEMNECHKRQEMELRS